MSLTSDSTNYFGIAGVQMHVSVQGDNVERIRNYVRYIRSRFKWVHMVLFSELAPLGPGPEKAEPMPGPTETKLAELARETGLWLVPGSIFERVQGATNQNFNTAPVINPNGEIVARHRKLFPFYPHEPESISGGSYCTVFDVPGVARFGVSICYDMWFPETTRTMVAMGAEVILHPTLTDTIDRDVELSISRASAATNQVYFFDINGVGDGGVGRSIVCGPSGDVLHQAHSGPEVIPIEVDLNRVRRERERGFKGNLGQPLKSFRDRRIDFDLYRRENGHDSYLYTLGKLVRPERELNQGTNGQENSSMEVNASDIF
jgi:deaminated glutathione amidase